MKKILVVEDNHLFGSLVCKMLRKKLSMPIVWVETFEDARCKINEQGAQFFIALLDLNLPDAAMGEAVDYAISKGIPSIVFTSRFTQELHQKIWAKGIIDYVLKEGPDSVNYIVKQIKRLERNQSVSILIAEDSELVLDYLRTSLATQGFNVFFCQNGLAALETLEQHPDIRMLITDFHMPEMDGFELIRKVRRKYSSQEFAIIGLSAQDEPTLSAKFLKYGANDYLVKPFSCEEFFCRVHLNIDMIEHIRLVRESAEKDFLTGLYNRRYFFENWPEKIDQESPLAVAMLDIDFFKQVNDTYGHDIGDQVLKEVAQILSEYKPPRSLLARFGGEEFCMVFNSSDESGYLLMEMLRGKIESHHINIGDNNLIQVTVSIGLHVGEGTDIDLLLTKADEKLYQAKERGRNNVFS